MARPHYTSIQRITSFWNRVAITADDNQCWLWQSSFFKSGYGQVYWLGRNIRAHRIAWAHPDYVIPDGMEICHSCDTPACCNPKHLFLGTHKDNMNDRDQKGRATPPSPRSGTMNNQAKLNENQVLSIRAEYIPYQITTIELGEKYGVDKSVIHDVVTRKTWKHI